MTKHDVILNVREIIEILQESGLDTSDLSVVGVPLSVVGASNIRCAGDEPKADFEEESSAMQAYRLNMFGG